VIRNYTLFHPVINWLSLDIKTLKTLGCPTTIDWNHIHYVDGSAESQHVAELVWTFRTPGYTIGDYWERDYFVRIALDSGSILKADCISVMYLGHTQVRCETDTLKGPSDVRRYHEESLIMTRWQRIPVQLGTYLFFVQDTRNHIDWPPHLIPTLREFFLTEPLS